MVLNGAGRGNSHRPGRLRPLSTVREMQMTFTQLDPPIPLQVIGKGDGYALAVIDYGQEHNLIWVTAIRDSGEIWCAPNPRVRMQPNWTMGCAGWREPAESGSSVATGISQND